MYRKISINIFFKHSCSFLLLSMQNITSALSHTQSFSVPAKNIPRKSELNAVPPPTHAYLKSTRLSGYLFSPKNYELPWPLLNLSHVSISRKKQKIKAPKNKLGTKIHGLRTTIKYSKHKKRDHLQCLTLKITELFLQQHSGKFAIIHVWVYRISNRSTFPKSFLT